MGERSVYGSFMLTLIVLIGLIAVWMINDNLSLVKQEIDRSNSNMSRIADSLEKLNATIKRGGIAMNSQQTNTNNNNAGVETKTTITNKSPSNNNTTSIRFANAEFRDPLAEDGGSRVSATQAFSGSMNYLIKNESLTGAIWGYCNDSLAERNLMDESKFEPVIAESWTISEDGLVFTIKIKKGVMWHPYIDPITNKAVPEKEVTTEDFKFWWDTIQNKDIPCDPIRTYWSLAKSLEVIDRYTFRVTWKEPYSLAKSSTLGLSPLPKHYYRPADEEAKKNADAEWAKNFISSRRNQYMVGCGPYKIGSWEQGKALTLVRNEKYYGPKPHIKTIIIRQIKDQEIRFAEFKKGGLDVCGPSPDQWTQQTNTPDYYFVTPKIENGIKDSWKFAEMKNEGILPKGVSPDYKYEKFQYSGSSYLYIGYNCSHPIFKDKNVRIAMTHLTNRQRIITEVFKDLGVITTGPFIPISPYYNKNIEPFSFDLNKAIAILEKAGWKDTNKDGILDKDIDGDGERDPFEFSIMVLSTSPEMRKYASIIQQDAKKVGINMKINQLEWSVLIQALEEKSFDVCTLAWGGSPYDSDPMQIWHSSMADRKKSSNHIVYKSPEADKLIELGRRTVDFEKRKAIYQKFHKLIHDDQPYTFLMARTANVLYSKKYRNNRIYKYGMNGNTTWIPSSMQKQ